MMGRRFVKVPFFAMPNLIAGKEIVPEMVQDRFVPKQVAERVNHLLTNRSARQQMVLDLHEVRGKLSFKQSGMGSVADRAAAEVLSVMN